MELETLLMKPIKHLVGNLMHLIVKRPDLMCVCLCASVSKSMDIHLQVVKRTLRYLKGTMNYRIYYRTIGDGELLGFTNSDYAGDIEDKTSGYVFLMNSNVVSWCSKNSLL